MSPLKTFNGWVVSKLTAYLTAHQGFTQVSTNYTSDDIRTVVEDAFGFRYEISVKTIGRIQTPPNGNLEARLFEMRHYTGGDVV